MIALEELRLRLGLAADDAGMDEVIVRLAAEAEAYVRAYCRLKEAEEIPAFLLVQMIAEDYGKLGGAGVESRTIGSAAEHYRDGYSASVTAVLRGMRHPGGTLC